MNLKEATQQIRELKSELKRERKWSKYETKQVLIRDKIIEDLQERFETEKTKREQGART